MKFLKKILTNCKKHVYNEYRKSTLRHVRATVVPRGTQHLRMRCKVDFFYLFAFFIFLPCFSNACPSALLRFVLTLRIFTSSACSKADDACFDEKTKIQLSTNQNKQENVRKFFKFNYIILSYFG